MTCYQLTDANTKSDSHDQQSSHDSHREWNTLPINLMIKQLGVYSLNETYHQIKAKPAQNAKVHEVTKCAQIPRASIVHESYMYYFVFRKKKHRFFLVDVDTYTTVTRSPQAWDNDSAQIAAQIG